MNRSSGPQASRHLKVLERAFLLAISKERFELQRNVSFGGAALSAAILVALTQVGTKAIALQVTTISAAFSLPTWVALALYYELYLHLGPSSYQHISTALSLRISNALWWIASIGLLTAMCGVIWFLLPVALAAIFFGAVIALLLFGVLLFELNARLAAQTTHQSHGDEA